MMVLFKDNKDNTYYIKDDKLYVDLVAVKATRLIGRMTYNLNTGKSNIIINRESANRWRLGHLVSAAVFDHFSIDKVVIIEDNSKIYILEWERVKDQQKAWRFNPSSGLEEQIILPIALMSLVKEVDTPTLG